MTGFALLDVAIGVIFAFLTFSLIATSMQEALASIFNWRGRMLRRGLFRLLENASTSKTLVSQTWIAEAIEASELTVDLLNDPTMRSLQGSKSFLGKILGGISSRLAKVWQGIVNGFVPGIKDSVASAGVSKQKRKNNAQIMKDLGRMPSAIPKETFAKSLLNTLYDKIKDDVDAKIKEVKQNTAESLDDVKARVEKAIDDAKEAAEKARQEAIARGETPPTDDPLTLSDDVIREARQMLTPAADQVKTFATSIATSLDDAMGKAEKLINELPMDPALQKKIKAALKSMAITQALKTRFDQVEQLLGDVEEEVAKQIKLLEKFVEETTAEIGEWFDQGMDRVTGWYVRRAKYVLFALGFIMAMVVNFDIIGYGGQLMNDKDLREKIVAQAEAAVAAEAVGDLQIESRSDLILSVLLTNTQDREKPEITADEIWNQFDKIPLSAREKLGLSKPQLKPTNEVEAEAVKKKLQPALDQAAKTLTEVAGTMIGAFPVDKDGDGKIDDAERRAAANSYVDQMRKTYQQSIGVLQTQFADQGAKMGRVCPVPPGSLQNTGPPSAVMNTLNKVAESLRIDDVWNFFWKDSLGECIAQSWQWQAFLSWLIIGLGCTLGGQFWFDMLKNLLKVRTAASGISSDLKNAMGGQTPSGQNPAPNNPPPGTPNQN